MLLKNVLYHRSDRFTFYYTTRTNSVQTAKFCCTEDKLFFSKERKLYNVTLNIMESVNPFRDAAIVKIKSAIVSELYPFPIDHRVMKARALAKFNLAYLHPLRGCTVKAGWRNMRA